MDGKEEADRLDWIENCGLENLRYHIQSTELLTKESNTTLNIFLAGAGAFLAYALKGIESIKPEASAYSAIGVSLYLFVLCGLVVLKCLKVKDIPTPTNEPENLNHPDYSLQEVKKVELRNLQARIKMVTSRNKATSNWLNHLRMAAIVGVPMLGILIFIFAQSCLFDWAQAGG